MLGSTYTSLHRLGIQIHVRAHQSETLFYYKDNLVGGESLPH
jgi:hypothetical protein